MNRIDHIVINTRDHIDQTAAYFERMGFIVTPRGFHTMGLINHTVVFKTDYLELLGYPADKPPEQRPEMVQVPAGLMATVLKAHDADQVRATLMTHGLTPRPIFNLSRPIDLGNGKPKMLNFASSTWNLMQSLVPVSTTASISHRNWFGVLCGRHIRMDVSL
jgi:hypothetical protein